MSSATHDAGRRRRLRGGSATGALSGALFLAPILFVVALWEALARFGDYPPSLLPAFSDVMVRFTQMILSGDILSVTGTTLQRAVLGLLIAVLVGISVGLAMSRWKAAHWFFDPFISFGFSTPTITLLPVFILWFGAGAVSEVLLVALSCFFPVALSAFDGARSVPQVFLWSARAMGTRENELLRRVVLPAATSFVFAGIRVALPLAVIIAVLAEMIGGGDGLGYMLMYGYRFLDAPAAFAALIAILILGLLVDQALLWGRRLLLPWEADAS